MKKTIVLAGLILNVIFLVFIVYFILTSGDGGKLLPKKLKSSSKKPVPSSVKSSGAVLRFTSKPSGAKIVVNGYYKGKTPGEVIVGTVSKSAKEYVVKVVKEGFIPSEKKVKLVSGDKKRFKITLKRKSK